MEARTFRGIQGNRLVLREVDARAVPTAAPRRLRIRLREVAYCRHQDEEHDDVK